MTDDNQKFKKWAGGHVATQLAIAGNVSHVRKGMIMSAVQGAYDAGRRDAVDLCLVPHPVAWVREWDGDVSDIGNMIIVFEESDLDDGRWTPLYCKDTNN